jgi:hypothetical protein
VPLPRAVLRLDPDRIPKDDRLVANLSARGGHHERRSEVAEGAVQELAAVGIDPRLGFPVEVHSQHERLGGRTVRHPESVDDPRPDEGRGDGIQVPLNQPGRLLVVIRVDAAA